MSKVLLEKQGRVARITINRPEVRNAFDPETRWLFSEALDDVDADDDVWLLVVTGAGDQAFSAGRDLKHTAAARQHSPEQRARDDEWTRRARMLQQRRDFFKPVIAAVNGFALGGGLELALAADIIVAVEDAELGLPEPRRGLIAGGGGVHRLPRQIPLKLAMGYLLSGRHMSAARAAELGLVNDVVPRSELESCVAGWVDDILSCAPLAVRATKQAAMQGLEHASLWEAWDRDYAWELRRRASDDAREGPLAFSEKRPPRWTGR